MLHMLQDHASNGRKKVCTAAVKAMLPRARPIEIRMQGYLFIAGARAVQLSFRRSLPPKNAAIAE